MTTPDHQQEDGRNQYAPKLMAQVQNIPDGEPLSPPSYVETASSHLPTKSEQDYSRGYADGAAGGYEAARKLYEEERQAARQQQETERAERERLVENLGLSTVEEARIAAGAFWHERNRWRERALAAEGRQQREPLEQIVMRLLQLSGYGDGLHERDCDITQDIPFPCNCRMPALISAARAALAEPIPMPTLRRIVGPLPLSTVKPGQGIASIAADGKPACSVHGAMNRVSGERDWWRCLMCNIGVECTIPTPANEERADG